MKRKVRVRKQLFDEKGVAAFAAQLKKLRDEKDISQIELSERAGLSLSQIARIETARINPTLSTLLAIARGLDIDMKELFAFKI